MTNQIPPYRKIAKEITEGNCALFLGAGTSIISTQELINHLSQKLEEKEPLPKEVRSQGLAKVAQYYVIKVGNRDEMERRVRDFISDYDKVNKSLRIHKLLTKLPPTIIFTTNYDRSIEKEFERKKREYEVIINEHDFRNWDEKKTMIIKLHGSVNGSRDLIITDDDYIKFLMEPSLLKNAFKYILSTRKIIFVGYSLLDYNVKLLLEETNKVIKKKEETAKCEGYIIQDTPWGEQEKKYWEERGLKIFKLKGDEFLKGVRDAINTLEFKDKVGKSFDFWLDNYRLKALSYIKERMVDMFIKDIRENIIDREDYAFKEDIKEVFSSFKNQRKLIPLFSEENLSVIDTILNNIELSEDIICDILLDSYRQKEEFKTLTMLDYLLHKKSRKFSKRIKEHILVLSESPESSEEIKEKAKATLEIMEDNNVNPSSSD